VSHWRTDDDAVRRAQAWADSSGRLFSSVAWGHVLGALGAQPRYAWNEALGEGMMVPVFRRGPLKVGFLGFPVVPRCVGDLPLAFVPPLAERLGLHIVRVNQPMAGEAVASGLPGLVQPDAWIDDLGAWREDASRRRVRDLAHARRAGGSLAFIEGPCAPRDLHGLYAAVVRAHRGTARYSAAYFERLLSMPGDRVRVVHALDPQGSLAGAAVLAMDGDTGYYLHAAVSAAARPLGVSDELLSRLIAIARRQGLSRFNLMASPANQPGLLRFKAKWADREGVVLTRDYGQGWLGRVAVGVNAALSRLNR